MLRPITNSLSLSSGSCTVELLLLLKRLKYQQIGLKIERLLTADWRCLLSKSGTWEDHARLLTCTSSCCKWMARSAIDMNIVALTQALQPLSGSAESAPAKTNQLNYAKCTAPLSNLLGKGKVSLNLYWILTLFFSAKSQCLFCFLTQSNLTEKKWQLALNLDSTLLDLVHVEKYPNFFPWNDNFCLEFCHKPIWRIKWRKHQIVWVHELFFREMTRLAWNFDFDTNQFDE